MIDQDENGELIDSVYRMEQTSKEMLEILGYE